MSPEAIIIRGRYYKMIKDLTSDTEIRPRLFDNMYKAYIFCAIYGLMKGRRNTYNPKTDETQDGEIATIRSEVLVGQKGKDNYFNIRKMIILMDDSRGYTIEEKVDAALRFDIPIEDDSDEYIKQHSKYNSNTELINMYALGGLELFYNSISECDTTESLIYRIKESEENLRKSLGYE